MRNNIILSTNVRDALMNRVQCIRDKNSAYDDNIDELIALRDACCGGQQISSSSSLQPDILCCPDKLYYYGALRPLNDENGIPVEDSIGFIELSKIAGEDCMYSGSSGGDDFTYWFTSNSFGLYCWVLTNETYGSSICFSEYLDYESARCPSGNEGSYRQLNVILRGDESYPVICRVHYNIGDAVEPPLPTFSDCYDVCSNSLYETSFYAYAGAFIGNPSYEIPGGAMLFNYISAASISSRLSQIEALYDFDRSTFRFFSHTIQSGPIAGDQFIYAVENAFVPYATYNVWNFTKNGNPVNKLATKDVVFRSDIMMLKSGWSEMCADTSDSPWSPIARHNTPLGTCYSYLTTAIPTCNIA